MTQPPIPPPIPPGTALATSLAPALARTARPAWLLAAGLGLCGLGLAVPRQETVGTLPPLPSFATADSNGQMIAVTGIDLTGSSVLYLIDTESKQLAVYQATAGGSSTTGVKLIGARRIDLDLQLFGYNDRSEFSYRELQDKFSTLGEEGAPGAARGAGRGDGPTLPEDGR